MASLRKLLFISPCTPDPQGTGWEQRAFAFLRAYSKFTDVELWFTPTPDNPELLRIEKLTRFCIGMTSFHPLLVNDEKSTMLKRRLNQSLSTSDAVHVFRLPEMVSALHHRLLVWDIDELPWSARQISPDQRRHLEELYSRCFRKCRMVFASSGVEKQHAHFDGIAVIPNVAIDPQRSAFESSEKSPVLLFVGSLNYSANIDALAFFSDSVMPTVARSIPNIILKAIGRSPVRDGARSAVNQFQATGRFQFVFDVPSCTPHYLQAVASISPILYGGGTRIKIIESFAHRCPVVSTTKGCEGLEVAHRKHLLIDDTPDGFASACVELIQTPQLRREVAENAYSFFERNHSQSVVDRLLVTAFRKL
jgi:glycosyltransferase involved in cell wall biosynthesis